jgi:hypothetical protein
MLAKPQHELKPDELDKPFQQVHGIWLRAGQTHRRVRKHNKQNPLFF